MRRVTAEIKISIETDYKFWVPDHVKDEHIERYIEWNGPFEVEGFLGLIKIVKIEEAEPACEICGAELGQEHTEEECYK